MFEQIPDKETQNCSKTASNKQRRRRKKKFIGKKKNGRKDNKKKNPKLAVSMSSWAENFTVAATWQLKHQIAYWKAKAKALEYENQVLHTIIRQNHFTESVVENKLHTEEDQMDNVETEIENNEESQEDAEFEVSEEFIQFLTENAKYKEDARRERERLRAKNEEEESKLVSVESQETSEERQQNLKQLYGSNWQKIAALEMALQSQFMHDTDRDKPMYWPNIPFNFNFN
ncbi:gem-associated protein 8-like [Battus philenor]|uniref:gem-associated protein 8-like n=1 Tax=Battus philenor TaxID=42288 RepID=UPI0035CEDB38